MPLTIDWSEFTKEEARELWNSSLLEVSAVCLLFYDYSLTLPTEIRYIWKRKFTGASAVYLVIRYCALVNLTLTLLGNVHMFNFKDPDFTCALISFINQGFNGLELIIVAAFAATRIYAIWMCNWWLFAVVFLLGVFEPASDLYFSAHDTFLFAPWPLPTCIGFVDDSVTDRLFFGIPIATSAVKIAFELSVFTLTVAKTIGIQRETWSLGIRTPLTTLLLRDGSIYFLLLCAFAVADLITRLVPSNNSLVGISSVFTPAVTPILITRFILNLRQVGLADISPDRDGTVTGLPTLQFAGSRLIGNLGCQLSHGPSAHDDDLDIWDDSEGLPTEETLNPSPDEGGNEAPGANILDKGGRVGDGYI